jgi:hypothetical protein
MAQDPDVGLDASVPTINLGGNLPNTIEQNGLAGIVGALRQKPAELHVCVVVLDASSRKVITDTSEIQPTIRIRQIEPVFGPARDQALAMLSQARIERGVGNLEDHASADT